MDKVIAAIHQLTDKVDELGFNGHGPHLGEAGIGTQIVNELAGIKNTLSNLDETLDLIVEHLQAPAHMIRMREALELIAAPMRPDGTWNRDRQACAELARGALGG